MVNFEYKDHYTVYDLKKLIEVLRGEGGCAWDREQTHESIRRNFLEEAYEAVEAIDEKDTTHLCEELGDVLMQVIFHARMEEEKGGFDLDDVADMTCKKLIVRHPHVFGDRSASNSEEALQNWDDIKKSERHQKTVSSTMDTVARALPALWRAEKVQKKAAKAGFDWPDVNGALDKLEEETAELRAACENGEGTEEELGDILFSAVNAARFLDIDPEQALTSATDKFIKRFTFVENKAKEKGQALENMTLAEMDALWDRAKEY